MANEIRKPTASTGDSGIIMSNPGQAYDTATGGDETTNADWYNVADSTYRYHTWQTPIEVYTALTLYVKWSGTTAYDNDIWGIEYSLNGGGSWGNWLLAMGPNGNAAIQTESAILANDQILSDIEVRIVYDRVGGGDKEYQYIWDIWTDGVYTESLPDRDINIDYELGYTTEDVTIETGVVSFVEIDAYSEGFTTEDIITLIPEYHINTYSEGFTTEDVTALVFQAILDVNVFSEGFTTEDIITSFIDVADNNVNVFSEGFTTESISSDLTSYIDVFSEAYTVEDITLSGLGIVDLNIDLFEQAVVVDVSIFAEAISGITIGTVYKWLVSPLPTSSQTWTITGIDVPANATAAIFCLVGGYMGTAGNDILDISNFDADTDDHFTLLAGGGDTSNNEQAAGAYYLKYGETGFPTRGATGLTFTGSFTDDFQFDGTVILFFLSGTVVDETFVIGSDATDSGDDDTTWTSEDIGDVGANDLGFIFGSVYDNTVNCALNGQTSFESGISGVVSHDLAYELGEDTFSYEVGAVSYQAAVVFAIKADAEGGGLEVDVYDNIYTTEDITASIPVIGELNIDSFDEAFTTESVTTLIPEYHVNLFDEAFTTESVITLIPEYHVDTYDLGFTTEEVTIENSQLGNINVFSEGFTTEDITALIPEYHIDSFDLGFTTEDVTASIPVIGELNVDVYDDSIASNNFSDVVNVNLVPDASAYFDTDGTGWWEEARSSFVWNSGTKDATCTVTEVGYQAGIHRWTGTVQGIKYRFKWRAKSSNSTEKMRPSAEGSYTTILNPNLTTEYQNYEFIQVAPNINPLIVFDASSVPIGREFTIDDIIFQQISNVIVSDPIVDTYDDSFTTEDITLSGIQAGIDLFDDSIVSDPYLSPIELVINGDFANWTSDDPDGWDVTEVGDATSNITQTTPGQLNLITDGTSASVSQTILTAGKSYYYSIDVKSITGTFALQFGADMMVYISSPGVHTGILEAGFMWFIIKQYTGTPCNAEIDDVSVKEVSAVTLEVSVNLNTYDDIFTTEDVTALIPEYHINTYSEGFTTEDVTVSIPVIGELNVDVYDDSIASNNFSDVVNVNAIPAASSTFETDGTGWWSLSNGTVAWNSGSFDMTFTVNNVAYEASIYKYGQLVIGRPYRFTWRAKSSNSTSKMGIADAESPIQILNPSLNTEYQNYEFIVVECQNWSPLIKFGDTFMAIGKEFTIDDIVVQQIPNVIVSDPIVDTYDDIFTTEDITSFYQEYNIDLSEFGYTTESLNLTRVDAGAIVINLYDDAKTSEGITTENLQLGDINLQDFAYTIEYIQQHEASYIESYDFVFTTEDIIVSVSELNVNAYSEGFTTEDIIASIPVIGDLNVDVYSEGFTTEDIITRIDLNIFGWENVDTVSTLEKNILIDILDNINTTEDVTAETSFIGEYYVNVFSEGFTTEEVTALIPEYHINVYNIAYVDSSMYTIYEPLRDVNGDIVYDVDGEIVWMLIDGDPRVTMEVISYIRPLDDIFTTEDVTVEFDVGNLDIDLFDLGYTTEFITTLIPEYYIDLFDEGYTTEDITLSEIQANIDLYDEAFTTEDITLFYQIYNIDLSEFGYTTESLNLTRVDAGAIVINVYEDAKTVEDIVIENLQLGDINIYSEAFTTEDITASIPVIGELNIDSFDDSIVTDPYVNEVELITVAADREFSSDTGFWTINGNTAITGGEMVWTNNTDWSGFLRYGFVTTGKTYRVSFNVTSLSEGRLKAALGNNSGELIDSTGWYSEEIFAQYQDFYLNAVDDPTTAAIDDISIKEVSAITLEVSVNLNTYDEGFTTEDIITLIPEYNIDLSELGYTTESLNLTRVDAGAIVINLYEDAKTSEDLTFLFDNYLLSLYDEAFTTENISLSEENYILVYDEGFTTEDIVLSEIQANIDINDILFIRDDLNLTDNMILNGEFSIDDFWDWDSGWDIDLVDKWAHFEQVIPDDWYDLVQSDDINMVPGRYRISFDIDDIDDGDLRWMIGTSEGIPRDNGGTFVEYFDYNETGGEPFIIRASGDCFEAFIDNIVLQRVTTFVEVISFIDSFDNIFTTEDITINIGALPSRNIDIFDDLYTTELVTLFYQNYLVDVYDDAIVTESLNLTRVDAGAIVIDIYEDAKTSEEVTLSEIQISINVNDLSYLRDYNVGDNLVINGTFDTGTSSWILTGIPWSYDAVNKRLLATDATISGNTRQILSCSMVNGDQFEITFDAYDVTANGLSIVFGGPAVIVMSGSAHYNEILTVSNPSIKTIYVVANQGIMSGSFDNFTVRKVFNYTEVVSHPGLFDDIFTTEDITIVLPDALVIDIFQNVFTTESINLTRVDPGAIVIDLYEDVFTDENLILYTGITLDIYDEAYSIEELFTEWTSFKINVFESPISYTNHIANGSFNLDIYWEQFLDLGTWTVGGGKLIATDIGGNSRIYNISNGLLCNTFYDISFDVANLTGGTFLAQDYTVTSNGHHHFIYSFPCFGEPPAEEALSFRPTPSETFSAEITNVYIIELPYALEVISYIDLYDDSIVTESIFIEQPQFIFVYDDVYTTEIVEVRSELYLGIFDNILANEYIYGVIPGGKEIFTDLYINNKIRKAMKVPLMEVEASISVNKIIRKNIGL